MKTNNFKLSTLFVAGMLLAFTSCKKDETTPDVVDTTKKDTTVVVNYTKHDGVLYNINGSLKGSWDLVGDSARSHNTKDTITTSKDLMNTDMIGLAFTGTFKAGAASGTNFVKANSLTLTSGVTLAQADTAYKAGTPVTEITSVAVNDIFIAKLRGGSDYAVIKFLTIDATDNTCGCNNKGKATFEYWKK